MSVKNSDMHFCQGEFTFSGKIKATLDMDDPKLKALGRDILTAIDKSLRDSVRLALEPFFDKDSLEIDVPEIVCFK